MLVRDPPTKDLASPDRRRYFCDKPPGQSFAGAGFFFLFRSSGIADDHPLARDFEASRPERLSLRRTDRLLTIATSGMAAAAASANSLSYAASLGSRPTDCHGRRARADVRISMAGVRNALLRTRTRGSPVAPVAGFSVSRDRMRSKRVSCASFAGVFAGLAVATEYTLATFVVSVCRRWSRCRRQTDDRRRRSQPWAAPRPRSPFCSEVVGPAILLGFYHWSMTGDPFVPAYRYEVEPIFAAVHAKGGGIPLTSLQPNALHELLVGSSIGLFLFAPAALVWAVPGIVMLLRDRFWLGADDPADDYGARSGNRLLSKLERRSRDRTAAACSCVAAVVRRRRLGLACRFSICVSDGCFSC